MISSIQSFNQKQTNFKAVPQITRSAKAIGETKFVITNQVGAIKSALIDILEKTTNGEMSTKLKEILEKYHIKLNNGIQFTSLTNIEEPITLFLNKNKDGQDCLRIKSEKDGISYIFDKNNVIKQDNNGSIYLTQEEVDETSFENFITNITKEVDFPLLEIRKSFLPPAKPYIPKRVYKPRATKITPKNNESKAIKKNNAYTKSKKTANLPPIVLDSEKELDNISLCIIKPIEIPVQEKYTEKIFFNKIIRKIINYFDL